ncbi:hypothetical protein RB195_001662 [Necator americanus]|uniref:Uncharacterized protein n=1 Tax=Necator americanus TaxID=51031 RepID=A0ABR1DFC9_NECAM
MEKLIHDFYSYLFDNLPPHHLSEDGSYRYNGPPLRYPIAEPGQEDVDEEEISDAIFTLNEMNISQCSSYVYQGREINMMNNLTSELGRRKRVAWGAYKSIEDAMKMTKNIRLQAHLFNTTVLFALTYASENWTCRKQEENAISVIERAIERVVLIVSGSTPVKEGIRNSLLRHRSKIRDAANERRWANGSFESLVRRKAIGQHLRALGSNGSIMGARPSKSMNKGSGDTDSLQVLSKQFVDVYWNEDKSRALVRADLDKFKAEHKNQAHVFCYVDEVLPQGS